MRLQRDNLNISSEVALYILGQLKQPFDFPSPAAITSTLTNYRTCSSFWITCTSFEEFATCLFLTFLPKFVTHHSFTLRCLHRFKIRGVQSPKIPFWTWAQMSYCDLGLPRRKIPFKNRTLLMSQNKLFWPWNISSEIRTAVPRTERDLPWWTCFDWNVFTHLLNMAEFESTPANGCLAWKALG